MRILVVTQVLDENDPALGFFVGLTGVLAKKFESVQAVCLYKGSYQLPQNVSVLSLGKERKPAPAFIYALRFLKLAWRLRGQYDAVFVHMNQEYILLAGWLWKLLGKRVYLWRNHYAGNVLTDIAAMFSEKVFCTSKHSYTAKYKKTVLMPVGIDTDIFHADSSVARPPHSILSLGRVAPSKRVDILMDALGILKKRGTQFIASIVGDALPEHDSYARTLQQRVETLGLLDVVRFLPGVPNKQTPKIYSAHEIFVNCSPSGMYDKTLFEAAACDCIVVSASPDFEELVHSGMYFEDVHALADQLEKALAGGRPVLRALIETESLDSLSAQLYTEFTRTT